MPAKNSLVEISQQLLEKVKAKKSTKALEKELKEMPMSKLYEGLKTDEEKLAFWINIYNAFIQIKLNDNPKLYDDRGTFFTKPQIDIAGETLCFQKIEHGFIRKSQWDKGGGYIRTFLPKKMERKLRVDDRDWRIHFALNCGAKSCPPVGIYSADNLDKELDFMTKRYLKNTTEYDKKEDVVKAVALFSWFRGDFGGKRGTKKILKNQGLIPDTKVDLKFLDYDWTLLTNQFVDIDV